jgi:O-antigen/teichoic acid export membrane protein
MHARSRRFSDWSTVFGFAFSLLAGWLLIYRDGFGRVAWPLLAVGFTLMFAGFWFYVRAKGYHPAWTFLFFVFGPILFFVFFCLPDRHEPIRA